LPNLLSPQKYYPPDFDPAKIPKLKLPKDRQYVVRLMAPFNMRVWWVWETTKTQQGGFLAGSALARVMELGDVWLWGWLWAAWSSIPTLSVFPAVPPQTDPENTDYTMEHGATRNFQAEKLLEEEEKRMQKEREEEELNNPMKVLENRTKDSKLEMEVLENLQELKELNQRQANVDFEAMLKQYKELEEEQRRREQE
ncbi:YJU2 factor, partial [Rhodinocichla rosea]|nr:YJU2 factor [Rhodinocichla rosea]